ncbi:MAG: rod shape-determining protein MreD [Candidatus Margulisbacteria bacterium]|jgi:rod shape-determining protein MreD|nr:rod shape-determining protein MreD [Candidatus Margulisiibacteriota bacterium]
MRGAKLALVLVALLIGQTVIAPRFSFLGITPDLVLVTVIVFSVLGRRDEGLAFSVLAGLGRDLVSRGGYWHTVLLVLISTLIVNFREELKSDEYALTAGLVAFCCPLYFLVEALIIWFSSGQGLAMELVIRQLTAGTIYNLLLVPLCFPLLRRIIDVDR